MPGISTAKELRTKRANLAEQARELLDKASAEKRELSTEETQTFDRIHADIEKMGKDVERIERQESTEAEMRASRGVDVAREDRAANDGERAVTDPKAEKEERAKKYEAAFENYLRYGKEGLQPEERSILGTGFRAGDSEGRAAQTVTTTGGGYLIPTGFSGQLEESLKAFGGMREASTVFKTDSGNPLNWPSVDDTAQVGELLAINTAAAEQAVTYGQVQFVAYKYSSKLVLVPIELMQDSAFDLTGHLSSVLGTRLGRITNTHFTTGDGSGKPSGIVTGASSGVTAAGTATVTYDELLDLEHSVDPAYRSKSVGTGWMFNDTTFKKLRQLKDGDGRPLWQPGLVGGAADTINGWPFFVNQDCAAMTTGNKPVYFGALKKYHIRDISGITVLRLEERYAELAQVGFLAFSRHDGRLLDAGTDPVKFITMA